MRRSKFWQNQARCKATAGASQNLCCGKCFPCCGSIFCQLRPDAKQINLVDRLGETTIHDFVHDDAACGDAFARARHTEQGVAMRGLSCEPENDPIRLGHDIRDFELNVGQGFPIGVYEVFRT